MGHSFFQSTILVSTVVLLNLKIEKLVPGGEGLARHEGRVVFIPGVLPGEQVRVETTEMKKDFARAELREILEPSPDRIKPMCSLAGTCGGCDWLHIAPQAQAQLKVTVAQDALRRIGGIDWLRSDAISYSIAIACCLGWLAHAFWPANARRKGPRNRPHR